MSRAALPAAEAEEFYHADLVGLRAEDAEGRALGTVRGMHNFGAGDVIEIARDDGGMCCCPSRAKSCRAIEIEGGPRYHRRAGGSRSGNRRISRMSEITFRNAV